MMIERMNARLGPGEVSCKISCARAKAEKLITKEGEIFNRRKFEIRRKKGGKNDMICMVITTIRQPAAVGECSLQQTRARAE